MALLRSIRKGYSGARPDVVRLVPKDVRRVLDIGCGAGTTAALLAERSPSVDYLGVEPDAGLLPDHTVDRADFINLPIEQALENVALQSRVPFDAIILADVLEHLVSPASLLERLPDLLGPGGVVICSLPNVRDYSTFWRLLAYGRWPKQSRGIHDRTHLHFFCRADIHDLFSDAGFELCLEQRNLRLVEQTVLSQPPARLLDFWPFRAFITFQYLHRWRLKTNKTN